MVAFIQERAATARQVGAANSGPALLFFGCRHPEKDYLYRTELEAWERRGAVELIPCLSRPRVGHKSRKHVPDALWEDRERVWNLFRGGAEILSVEAPLDWESARQRRCGVFGERKLGEARPRRFSGWNSQEHAPVCQRRLLICLGSEST